MEACFFGLQRSVLHATVDEVPSAGYLARPPQYTTLSATRGFRHTPAESVVANTAAVSASPLFRHVSSRPYSLSPQRGALGKATCSSWSFSPDVRHALAGATDLSPAAQLVCARLLFRVFPRLPSHKPDISTAVVFTVDHSRYFPRRFWRSVSRVTCS